MNEQDWDDFAASYAQIQRESSLPIENDIVATLAARYPLAQLTIAELAAGSGRYTLPLAQHAQRVAAFDWSKNMLIEARRWLDAHAAFNVTYHQDDWHTLPAAPLADLVFVSQLPTLTANELPRLESLAAQAVAINTQTAQADAALARVAAALHWPLPPVYQADPARADAYRAALTHAQRPYHEQHFTYRRQQLTTTNELLQAFERPFSAATANAAATTFAVANAHTPITTTITYTFCLLDWRV